MSGAYTCNRLVEEAVFEGIDLRIMGVYDTQIRPEGIFNGGERLCPCDFVINRYKWGETKDGINSLAARTYNAIDAFNIYVNKYEQLKRLTSDAFLKPRYVMGASLLPYSVIAQELGGTFVAKGLESSREKKSIS